MSLLNSTDADFGQEKQARGRLLLGAVAALLFAALVLAGYSLLRKRHQQKVIAAQQVNVPLTTEPLGPPRAQILVDEAMMKGDQRLLGGTIKNISVENLSDLVVNLELVRRKDAATEKVAVPVEPKQLASQQEGHYSFQLRAADYISVKLVGLTSGASPTLIAYVAGAGQKRPPEKLEPKTIIVGSRPSTGKGGFLNTPDNPGRVP